MQLRIWDEKNIEGCDENQVFLRLLEDTDGSGDIKMTAVDKKGVPLERGAILIMSKHMGGIILNGALNEKIPMKTDFYGHPCVEWGRNLAITQKIMETQSYRIMIGQDGDLEEHAETSH